MIIAGVAWVIAMFNLTSPFLSASETIYDIVMFIRRSIIPGAGSSTPSLAHR